MTLRDIFLTLAGTVPGAVVGLVVGVLFEEPLRGFASKLRKRWLRRRSRRELARSADTPVSFGDTFAFGSLKTTIFIVDGNGDTPHRRDNIEVFVSAEPVPFPRSCERSAARSKRGRTTRSSAGSSTCGTGRTSPSAPSR